MPFNPQAEYDGGFRGVYYDADAAERLTQLILSHGRFASSKPCSPARCLQVHKIGAIA